MNKIITVFGLMALAAIGGCESRKPRELAVVVAPPSPETSRIGSDLCADTERPRGFRVEREALALVLAEERRNPPNYRGAYELAFELARQGNSAAILHLADLYRNPATGFANPAEAARLYDCALRLGAPQALVRHGEMLSARSGGRTSEARRADRKAAVALFERAAALGDLEGMNHLAHLLGSGRDGFPRSPALAREIREFCAATGDHACQYSLAMEMQAANHVEGAYFWLDILEKRPQAADPIDYRAQRDSMAQRLNAGQIARTKASTARWRRLSWGEVEWRWRSVRDRLLAML